MGKKFVSLTLVLAILALSGCWDRVEIEERGFVIGVAIDLADSEDKEGKGEESETTPQGKARYAVSFQFVIPEGLKADGGSGDAFFNVTTEAWSMMEAVRQLAMRTSRTAHFTHIKIIVISEDVAKKVGISDALDLFIRDHEMRRGTRVMISKGKALDVLNVKQPAEKLPITYIRSVAQNSPRTARMLHAVRIGDIHERQLSHISFTIPRIIAEKEEVKIAGAAVVQGKENKMVGWLGEEETIGLNWIKGEAEGGVQKVEIGGNLVLYEYKGKNTSIEVDVSNKEQIKFTITVESEGQIPESQQIADWLKPTEVREVEKKVQAETLRLVNKTVDKLQKEFMVDAMGLGSYLAKYHPKVWEEIKDEWDSGKNYFAKSTIEFKSKVIVRNTGVVNKTEER